MVNLWGDDENVTIINYGVLMLFWRCMVWFGCNFHNAINLLFLYLHQVSVSYWYQYWLSCKPGLPNWRCGVVLTSFNIYLLLLWWLVAWPG